MDLKTYVIAKIKAIKGKEEDLKQVLFTLAEHSNREVGCEVYQILQSKENVNEFSTYEIWKDTLSEIAHWETPHIREALQASQGLLLEEPVIVRYSLLM